MKVAAMQIDESEALNIRDAVENRQPLDFFCYTLNADQKSRFQTILKIFLDACDQSYLYNYLSYCLLELLDNASKANAKRIFFKENHLNIDDEKDYKTGIKSFKEDLSENPDRYKNELEEGMLQVHLQLCANDIISVTVSNNTKITNEEYKRIQEKIDKTKKYNDMADAVSDIDQTEGSGLGIITVVIMLKRLGLDNTNLKFRTTDKETIATIEIPKNSLMEI